MTFSDRRIRNSIVLILACLLFIGLIKYFGTPLYRIQLWSGWTLFSLICFLFFYSIRKKITFLPIGKASGWLQFHSYAGLFSMMVFFQHISFKLPSGIFETTLGILFIATALSGIAGMVFSRVIPRHLTRRGEEVIYERIPMFTFKLREQAKDLVFKCTVQTGSTAVADYYQNHLAAYFFKPRRSFFHFYGSKGYLHAMQTRHNNFCRYLNAQELSYADQLFELVTKKYDLDFHYVLQSILKFWQFIHLPLAYALLLSIITHLMLVYAFLGHLQ